MKKLNGFSGVEAFLVVLLIIVAGAVGYVFFVNTSSNKTATTSSVPANIKEITSTSDVDKVTTELNSLNIESDSTSDLDSITNQLNSF